MSVCILDSSILETALISGTINNNIEETWDSIIFHDLTLKCISSPNFTGWQNVETTFKNFGVFVTLIVSLRPRFHCLIVVFFIDVNTA